jgi:hypothetical protein
MDDEAFGESDISIEGIDADSLVFTCVLRRLVTAGDESIDELELRANRGGDTVSLSLMTDGDDWVVYELDRVEMCVGRRWGLDAGTVGGTLDVRGIEGFVRASVTEGRVDIETAKGCELDVESGDVSVSLQSDSTDPALDSLFEDVDIRIERGSVDVRVPRSLRARVSLSTGDGGIKIIGRAVSGREYEGALNGGASDRWIHCRVQEGDITLDYIESI